MSASSSRFSTASCLPTGRIGDIGNKGFAVAIAAGLRRQSQMAGSLGIWFFIAYLFEKITGERTD